MTKFWRFSFSVGALVVLAGCSPAPAAGSILTEDYEGALPANVQLILGTLQLEGTDLAVTAEQASSLAPLWKAVRSLSASDTAAEAELEAVLDQIQEGMASDQLEAIAAMELNQEDLFTTVQEMGIQPFAPSAAGRFLGSGTGDFIGGGSEGGPPGGGGEGGGPTFFIGPAEGPPGGTAPGGFVEDQLSEEFTSNLDPDQIETLEAQREAGGGPGARIAPFLLDPLIELLESRAGIVP
ncbi:MAG TPA: hypothetical protein VI520_03220 [Anaerolineales bacterium]|nr:hypothetical protein [Anaerolineales bacterium]